MAAHAKAMTKMSDESTGVPLRVGRASSPAWVLAVLSLIAVVNYIDRQVISILLVPIKADLHVSDTAMGLLTGTVFSLFYVAASLPIARMADGGNRRNILACCIALWSAMTVLCGLPQTYAQLLIARSGVAVAESGAVPISQALASSVFPPSRRATVVGILTAAGSVGLSAGLFIGGWINDLFNWRIAFMVVGGPGLLLALLLRLTVAEPIRSGPPSAGPTSMLGSLGELMSQSVFRWLVAASALSGFTTYALIGWTPTFFVRAHAMSTAEVGAGMGIVTLLGPVAGHLLAGLISDRLAARDLRWYPWFAAAGNLVAVPLGILFLFTNGRVPALVGFGVMMVFKSAWLAPVYAVAFRVSPPNLRAQASAVLTSCVILTGLGLGPLFVGVTNDALAPMFGNQSIRYSLMIVTLILLPGCLVFLAIARSVARWEQNPRFD